MISIIKILSIISFIAKKKKFESAGSSILQETYFKNFLFNHLWHQIRLFYTAKVMKCSTANFCDSQSSSAFE